VHGLHKEKKKKETLSEVPCVKKGEISIVSGRLE